MKKIALFCVLLLGVANIANAEFIEEFALKKDESKVIKLFVQNTQKTLSFRWTLYKDKELVLHLNYDRIPRQFLLSKENLNAFTIPLNHTNAAKSPNPHITIYFVDFDIYKKEAKFRYYLHKFDSQIEIL